MSTSTSPIEMDVAVRAAFRAHALRPPSGGMLVAVSGGVDSMVLLDVLDRLRAKLELSLVVGHVDHAVRTDSAADRAFVEDQALRRGLPFFSERLEAPGVSEAALREARYASLQRLKDAAGCERVALGHTRDDQVETFLFRLLRGSGPRGAGGMRVVDDDRVRPLLEVSRAAVLAYAAERGLTWRDDPTNADPRFSRNRLRHELLPVLRAMAPSADGAIARFTQALQAEHAALEGVGLALADTARLPAPPDVLVLDLARLEPAMRAALVPVLPTLVHRVQGSFPELSAAHLAAFADLLATRGRPRVLHLPGGVRVERRRDVLTLRCLNAEERVALSRARGLNFRREPL